MKNLWRSDLTFLLGVVLACVAWSWSYPARGEVIAATEGTLYGVPSAGIPNTHASQGAACSAASDFYDTQPSGFGGNVNSTVVSSSPSCQLNNAGMDGGGSCVLNCAGEVTHTFGYGTTVADTCPAGYQLSAGSCYGGCVAGAPISSGLYVGSATAPGAVSACDSGCTAAFSGGMKGRVQSGGAYVYYWEGSYSQAGPAETCITGDASPGPISAMPEVTCAPGQIKGTINGQTVCFSGTTGEPINPLTGTPSPGPTESTVTNGDGSTTKTTTNPDGSKKIETTSADGTTKETTFEGADPLKTYCAENPKAEACSPSAFGGACTSTFTCEGDAAECAAAVAVNEINCKLKADAASTTASLLAVTGLTTAQAEFDAAKISTSLSGVLEFNERTLAPASCPAPYQVTVLGAALEFSWAFFCSVASIIGLFVMVGAMVLSARIVLGGL